MSCARRSTHFLLLNEHSSLERVAHRIMHGPVAFQKLNHQTINLGAGFLASNKNGSAKLACASFTRMIDV